MDKRPDMPEKKKDEIDDILDIMHKRNTRIIVSPPAKTAAESAGAEPSKIKYSPGMLPAEKKAAEEKPKLTFSEVTDDGETVKVPEKADESVKAETTEAVSAESVSAGVSEEKTAKEHEEATVVLDEKTAVDHDTALKPKGSLLKGTAVSSKTVTERIEESTVLSDTPLVIDSSVEEPVHSPVKFKGTAVSGASGIEAGPTKIDMEPAVVSEPVRAETPTMNFDAVAAPKDSVFEAAAAGAVSLDDFNEEEIKKEASKSAKKKKKAKNSFLSSGWFGVIKVAIYLSSVILVSVFISVTFINIANDMFAFVKPEEIVAKIPSDSTVKEIEKIIVKKNIIKKQSDNRITVTIKKPEDLIEKNDVEKVLNDREISQITALDRITVKALNDTEFTMNIPAGVSAGDIAGILDDAGAVSITCSGNKIKLDKDVKTESILNEKGIPSKVKATLVTVEISPEISIEQTVSDVLNQPEISELLKQAGVTETKEISKTKFEVLFPENTPTDKIAKILYSVKARSVTASTEVTIVIKENATTADVAKTLKKAGIIEYPWVFEMYANHKIDKRSYLTGKYIAAEHKVSPTMNYDTLLDMLSDYERSVSGTVRVTIPEGLNVDEIIDLLVKNGVGKKEDYYKALQEFEYNYRFTQELTPDKISEHRFNTNISYRLEGYLFPDTYDFYLNENPISVLDKMLKNFDKKFEEEYYDRCEQLGITVDEAITIASMIEREGNNNKDFYMISLVFNNRLKDKSGRFFSLGSDATTQYALKEKGGDLYNIDVNVLHPYNTRHKDVHGLPPGPICNPSIEAINAALYPANLDNMYDTNYYYFYTKKNGETVFSKTEAAHNSVVAKDR